MYQQNVNLCSTTNNMRKLKMKIQKQQQYKNNNNEI